MPHLACRHCGRRLTEDCREALAAEHDVMACDRVPSVARGVFVRLAEDRSVVNRKGRHIGTRLVSPSGALALNPETVVGDTLVSSGNDVGCCGSDGCDGPNRACKCGQVVATEWSDCWTPAEVRFLPDAVVILD